MDAERGRRSSRRNTTTRGIRSTAAAATRSARRASWVTTCVSTSSAGRRTTRPRPGCRFTAKRPSCPTSSSSRGLTLVHARPAAADAPAHRADDSTRGSVLRVQGKRREPVGDDRPVGWTEHVTLGPPFLEKGVTEFRASATRSKVFEACLRSGRLPRSGSGVRLAGGAAPRRRHRGPAPLHRSRSVERLHGASDGSAARAAYFVAFSPPPGWRSATSGGGRTFRGWASGKRTRSRLHPPWNGQAMTRGMEFGVSPFPESRREMIERGRLFDVPTFRWIPAATLVTVESGSSCGRPTPFLKRSTGRASIGKTNRTFFLEEPSSCYLHRLRGLCC